jgi:hypothetical protein
MSNLLKYASILAPNPENPDEVFLRFNIPFAKEDIEDGDLDFAVEAMRKEEGLSEPEILSIGIQKFLIVSIQHGIKKTAEAKAQSEINAKALAMAAKQEARANKSNSED